jgi:uncharacterized protein
MPDIADARARFAAAAATFPTRYAAATTDRAAVVHLYGVIGAEWDGLAAADIIPALRALDVDTITVRLNSPGGNVYDGITLRNALREHPARILVQVDGLAASAASLIATAGDDVAMAPGSELMVHDVWSVAIGNADAMRDTADGLDRTSDAVAAMYAEKAGGDPAAWRAVMKAETWYSAQEAVDAGLADRLAVTPAAANLFDLSMYAHAGRAAASAPQPVAALAPNRKETPMTDALTRDDLDAALQEHGDKQNRVFETRLASLSLGPAAEPPAWPSFGAFLKDLMGDDPEKAKNAMTFYERLAVYDGSTTADDKQPNTWVRDALHLIKRTRRILGKFDVLPLPAEGMTLEYLQVKTNSIAVAKQAAQADNLVKGKIQLKSSTTPVETYGGWTELTRQQIDRGSAAYLSTSNTAMILEYARATEQVIRDLLKGILATKLAADPALSIAADADAYDWLDLIVDASMLFDDLSFTLAGGLVSVDVFKRLYRLEDSNGNSLMRVWGTGMNQIGEIDLSGVQGPKGNLGPVTFEILPGALTNTIEFHDTLGITTWESPGAPFRLQDGDVVNLTEKTSQYGYLASASQFPDAIQAVEVTGAGA